MSTSDKQSLQALAFLYLTFGHSTDGSMTGEEMRALGKKLQEWAPDAPLADLGEVLKTVVGEYKALSSNQEKLAKASEYTEDLKGHATPEQAQQILADLRGIASADGTISAEEEQFIAATAAAFGVSV